MQGTKTELEASVTSALKEPSLQAPFPTSFGFSFQFPWWIFFPSIVVTILIHIAEAPFFFCFFFYWWISIRLYLFWSNSLIILIRKLATSTQHYFFQYLWITKLKSYGILEKSCCFVVHAFVSTVNLHNCWLGCFLWLYLGNLKKTRSCVISLVSNSLRSWEWLWTPGSPNTTGMKGIHNYIHLFGKCTDWADYPWKKKKLKQKFYM